jgi:ribosomal protein S12 methylthiotransferase
VTKPNSSSPPAARRPDFARLRQKSGGRRNHARLAAQGGVEITNDAAQADAVIVNTCSFIDAAQEESVDTILESVEVRDAKNRGQAVIVSGCLPQRFRDELPKLMPEVDAFMGIDQVAQVGDIVSKAMASARKRSKTSKVQSPKSKEKSRRAR